MLMLMQDDIDKFKHRFAYMSYKENRIFKL